MLHTVIYYIVYIIVSYVILLCILYHTITSFISMILLDAIHTIKRILYQTMIILYNTITSYHIQDQTISYYYIIYIILYMYSIVYLDMFTITRLFVLH